MTVACIEVSSEDVGLVLQFLEFCTTFMKVICGFAYEYITDKHPILVVGYSLQVLSVC